MVLPFKKQFVQPILSGTKIHTIRLDKHNRWHAGKSIQMATGVRTKAYHQFNDDRADIKKCISTQKIVIQWYKFTTTSGETIVGPMVEIDGKSLTALQIHELAVADGFDNIDQFFEWFNTDFEGKIIHWTPKNY